MTAPKNAARTVWEALESGAALQPGAPAIGGERPLDYRSLLTTTRMLAAALQRAGIEPGDRVALLHRNAPLFLVWTFACAGVGAVLVPLNYRLSAAEIRDVLEDSRTRMLVAEDCFRELAESAGSGVDLQFVGLSANDPPFGLPLETDALHGFVAHASEEDDVAHLYYTSGTTGKPKGVPLTQRNVVQHALAAITELDLANDDLWGHVAPMFHLADAWATIAITLAGGCHVFLPDFDGRAALALFEESGVTVSNLVPTMLQRMLAAAPAAGFDGGSLRLVLSGGAPISPAAVAAVLDTFHCEYVQTYGLTETSPYLTLGILEPRHREESEERQLARRSRTGRPFETVELDVIDEGGRSVPRDDRTVGEIVARGSTITPGYWNRPAETKAAFRGGWFHTGDLATIDAEGWVNIVDRKKDMILTGGENVYSIEVENALYSHPAVLECAAYGAPSTEWGEEVRAAVVLRDGIERTEGLEAELREHCAERLARYKLPRAFVFMRELPKTGSGKIAKRLLR
ncbi:Long-chain-fatty-acid--CoA ligase [Planctomycetes bacterium Poly30]|uniref:Long-chain-fatty-acid--CoA ligase n=1 Tax=Saltatorellus ferox TaxID=2528018 RepID=A0A518EX57_9BACT|nr:Long-chain-fatty-acid--CoA ligase [Planctomycetes bacterium Poly30]